MPRDRDVTGVPPTGESVCCRAAEVGVLAHETLQRESSGRIAAAFDRSFYAAFGTHWICVGSSSIGSGPLHVLCEEWPSGAFAAGQRVTVTANVVHVDDAPLASLAGAPVWTPEPTPAWTQAQLLSGLQRAGHLWEAMPADEGLAALGGTQTLEATSPLLAAAMPGVRALERIAAGDNAEHSPAPADRAALTDLIGLGPGLTPSGDDVLIGVLLALAALGRSSARDALWAVCNGALDRTGDISRVHLEAASRGYGAAVLHDAIHVVMSGNAENIRPALAAVSAVGHTSGRDGMAGALVALRAAAQASTLKK